MVREFRSHPIYYVLTAGVLLLLVLLGWDLWHNATPATFLFVGIVLVITLWFISALGVRVTLAPAELTIIRPPWSLLSIFGYVSSVIDLGDNPPTKAIAYRQLISVEESGRFFSTLTLLYYPVAPDGLLDLEQIANLTLPIVRNQQDLRERLEAAIPQ